MSRPGIDWDNQPLGEISDKELAIALGVQPQTVGTARRERGIPSALAKSGAPKPTPRPHWGRDTLFDVRDHRGEDDPGAALTLDDVYSLLG